MRLVLLITAICIAGIYCKDAVSPCNKDTEFDCQYGPHRCVPLEWLCDNVRDCFGGQDEMRCNYLHSCDAGSLICREEGDCISSEFKCDGNADCKGGFDEAGCKHAEALNISFAYLHSLKHEEPQKLSWMDLVEQRCDKPNFQCSNGGSCILAEAVCDGLWDCPNGEDERDCSDSPRMETVVDSSSDILECPKYMTSCADRSACIPDSWVCDGDTDCEDHSDEFDCTTDDHSLMIGIQSNHHLCGYNEFRCGGSGMCIPYNRTCDHVSDCPLGDDEGSVCDACMKLRCSWRCQMTSSGSSCTCPEGSKLSADGYTCTEVNECETDVRRCHHYCENHATGYDCTCAPGYSIQKDGYSCRLDGSKEGMLLVSLGTEIRSMPLSEGAATTSYSVAQQIDNHGLVRSVSYMHKNKQLYMAVSGLSQEGELAVSADGIMHVLRENIPGIGQVAVDWIGGNVFYTQKAPASSPGIYVCNFNGFYCRQIIYGENSTDTSLSRRQTYRGLAVDPQHGKMFWIDGHDNANRIRMADLDGSNVETILNSKLEYPSGLAIDPIRGDLYFGDVEKEMIECVNIHTRERVVILTGGVHHPHELAYFNGFLYWSDWGTESLKVAEITHHHSSSHVIHSFNRFPYGISINHPHYQPQPNRDTCESIRCPWICVAVPGPDDKVHPKCLCPENYMAEGDSCVPRKTDSQNQNSSWMGVSLMEQLCAAKEACLNGGSCENLKNEHGRVHKIICSCPAGFEGDRCELMNDPLVTARLEDSSSSVWIVLFICMIFLAAAAAVFYFVFTNVDNIGSSFDRCFGFVEKKRDKFSRAGELGNIKDRVKRYMPYLSPRSRSERAAAASSGAGAFKNPMFAANVPEYDEPAVGVTTVSLREVDLHFNMRKTTPQDLSNNRKLCQNGFLQRYLVTLHLGDISKYTLPRKSLQLLILNDEMIVYPFPVKL